MTWKEAMEKKGQRVNAGKTKIMICGTGLDLLQSSGEFPCTVEVVGWCEGAVYLTSLGRPTDIGLQLGKACYSCSG